MTIDMRRFPFYLFGHDRFPEKIGTFLAKLKAEKLCLFPPFPWGQWLYAQIYKRHCRKLPGDIIEFGAARGGTSIFFGFLARRDGKKVLSLDSFKGLPKPHPYLDNPYFNKGWFGSDPRNKEDVYRRFCRHVEEKSLGGTVIPVKGSFASSLKKIRSRQKYCLVHVDADLYRSAYTALSHAYDRVVPGGVIILDDYFHHSQGVARAAADFFNRRKIYPVYHVAFPWGAFVFKGGKHDEARHPRCLDGNTYSFRWLKKDRYLRKVLNDHLARGKKTGRKDASRLNAESFRDLLGAKNEYSSDIYVYLKAMEEFWDLCAEDRSRYQKLPNSHL